MLFCGMGKQIQVFDGNGVRPLHWGVGRPSFRLTTQQSPSAHDIVNKTVSEWGDRVRKEITSDDLPEIIKMRNGSRWSDGDEDMILSECIELNEFMEDLAAGLGGTGGDLKSRRNLLKKIQEAIKVQYKNTWTTR